MKRIGPALGTAITSMLSMAYVDARTPLADVRKGLAETEAFFVARRNRADGVKLARDAQAKLDAFDQSLAAAAMITPTPPAESPLRSLLARQSNSEYPAHRRDAETQSTCFYDF